MDQLAGPAVVGSLAAVALLGVVVATVAVLRLRAHRRRTAAIEAGLRAELAAAHEAAVALEQQVARLQESRESYLITGMGAESSAPARPVPDSLVLSATLGEPLVRTLAFGHGLRRALSPEVRDRIRHEVRRETRRSRKQRRREMRQAWREARAEGRFDAGAAGEAR